MSSKFFPKKQSSKKFNPSKINSKAKKPEYLCAYLILDLSEKSIKGKIIRITELLLNKEGQTEFSQHLFSNEGSPISAEAFAHHKISEKDLVNKPLLSTYNFHKAQNIVVWDGHTTTSILKANNIRKTAPIINLLSLARFKEEVPKTIGLNKYAAIAEPNKKHTLDLYLRNPENKVFSLIAIHKYLQAEYLKLFDMNNPSFLCAAGRSRDKAAFNAAIEKATEKHKAYLAKQTKEPDYREPVEPESSIVVTVGVSQAKQGVTGVTILKRKKS